MLKITLSNNVYEAKDCYKTVAVVRDLTNQSTKINDFAIINLSEQEGNNQSHLDTLKSLVGQTNSVDVKNESNVTVITLDSTYTLTSVNEQIGIDGIKIVILSFNKN